MDQIITDETQTREERMVGETFTRGESAAVSNVDEKARTAELTFASELPYERWFGIETLQMTKQAADLGRLNNGGALLSDHNRQGQIGKVVKAWVGEDKRAHAIVQFSKNTRGQEEFQDVIDGIRTNVSFGYKIRKHEVEKGQGGAPDKVTATRWEALEISLVSVPADPTVGVGRSEEDLGIPEPTKQVSAEESRESEQAENVENREETRMDKPAEEAGQSAPANTAPAVVTYAREDAIFEYGRKFGVDDKLIRQFAFDPNGTVDTLRAELSKQYQATPATPAAPGKSTADLELSDKEVRSYSISRAIIAQADGNWDNAGFERECHDTIQKRMKENGMTQQGSGFLVPSDVQNQRDLSVVGGSTTGGALVATNLMPQSFIELLRSKMVMLASGVTVMSDLVGNPSIPRQDAAATGYWVAEGVAPAESQLTTGQLGLSPKTVGAMTEFTRQLLIQSTPSIDQLVKSDIAAVLARTIDLAIINGSGTAGQPTGILNTTGVTEVGMAGASFVFADAVLHETTVAEANASESSKWICRPSVYGALKTRTKVASSTFPIYLVEGGLMNGYGFGVSTQVPASTLIFGDLSTVILGEWGILEIEANKYGSSFGHGGIQVRGLHMVDVAVRYPQALTKLTAFA